MKARRRAGPPEPGLRFGEAADRGSPSRWPSCGRRRGRSTGTRSRTTCDRGGARRLDCAHGRRRGPWCASCAPRDWRVDDRGDREGGEPDLQVRAAHRLARENPFVLLENGERPKMSETPERRIYERDELAQTLGRRTEPWTTLFRLASVTGAGRASCSAGGPASTCRPRRGDGPVHAPGRSLGRAGAAEDEESKAMLPLPRAAGSCAGAQGAKLAHAAGGLRVRTQDRPGAGSAQRAARALPRQERARTRKGSRRSRSYSSTTAAGIWSGRRRPVRAERRPAKELACRTSTGCGTPRRWTATTPRRRGTFCATRTATSRGVYRAHFGERAARQLRAKMEARMEAAGRKRRAADGGRDLGGSGAAARIAAHGSGRQQRARACHAEGRGFESLQPLSQKARFCGPFVCLGVTLSATFEERRGPLGPLSVRFQLWGVPGRPLASPAKMSPVLPPPSTSRSTCRLMRSLR